MVSYCVCISNSSRPIKRAPVVIIHLNYLVFTLSSKSKAYIRIGIVSRSNLDISEDFLDFSHCDSGLVTELEKRLRSDCGGLVYTIIIPAECDLLECSPALMCSA